jgi:hypothetical protein
MREVDCDEKRCVNSRLWFVRGFVWRNTASDDVVDLRQGSIESRNV